MVIARWSASTTAVLALFLVPTTAAGETRRVFLTSTSGTADLSSWAETDLDGLAGADQICQTRADAENLGGTFRAWLSTEATDAYCHLMNFTGTRANVCNTANPDASTFGPWVRMDGTPFAGTLAQMTGSEHLVYQPVRFDETGALITGIDARAWTATDPDGVQSGTTCGDWSLGSDTESALTGVGWSVGREWTDFVSLDCDTVSSTLRLYCFEVDTGGDPLDLPNEPGALVFVTSVSGNGQLGSWADAGGETGLAAGDAICRARAAAAFLPRPDSFVAWLSDETHDAKDRVTEDGPFVRLDGFLFAPSKAALLGTSPDVRTGLNVTEEEFHYVQPIAPRNVWTGSLYTGAVALDDHCVNWTSELDSEGGGSGNPDSVRFEWQFDGSPYCHTPRPIYCFSNVELLFWDNFERADFSRWDAVAP